MPTNSFHVAAHFQCLSFEANSPSSVLNAVYSIDWARRLAGLPIILSLLPWLVRPKEF